MADTNALVAVDVDAGEKTRIKETVCVIKQAAQMFAPPPAQLEK